MSLTSFIVRPSPNDPSELKDIFIGFYQEYFYLVVPLSMQYLSFPIRN